MLSDVRVCVCVCERMHLSQCTWLYLKVSLYPKHTHQDQSSTPEGPLLPFHAHIHPQIPRTVWKEMLKY